MGSGYGIITGHLVTLRRFWLTFWRDIRERSRGVQHRRGGGHQFAGLLVPHKAGAAASEPTLLPRLRTPGTSGLFTVEYPDERLPSYERFRVLPVLIYDNEDGNVRCTSCNICAKVCPPQCIWMTQAKGPKGVVPLPEDFYIDMDVCMNCGGLLLGMLLPVRPRSRWTRTCRDCRTTSGTQTHIYSLLQDLLVSERVSTRGPIPRRGAATKRWPSGTRSRRRRTSGSRRPSARPPSRPPPSPRPPPSRSSGGGGEGGGGPRTRREVTGGGGWEGGGGGGEGGGGPHGMGRTGPSRTRHRPAKLGAAAGAGPGTGPRDSPPAQDERPEQAP